MHTCDARSPKARIRALFAPPFVFERRFAAVDALWRPDWREPEAAKDARLRRLLDDVFSAAGTDDYNHEHEHDHDVDDGDDDDDDDKDDNFDHDVDHDVDHDDDEGGDDDDKDDKDDKDGRRSSTYVSLTSHSGAITSILRGKKKKRG